jgi:predicted ATPase with chaperone activity
VARFFDSATLLFGLSARGHARLRRVARMIADLAGEECVGAAVMAEAFSLRTLDRSAGA